MQGTITDERSAVVAIKEALSKLLGPKKFQIWFESSTRLTLTGDYLKIIVPNLFLAGWIENHFLDQINLAVRQVAAGSRKITFLIDPAVAAAKNRTEANVSGTPHTAYDVQKAVSGQTRRSACRNKLKLSLDTFVVGPSNELAYNAAKALVKDKQSPFNPLFIHGGYGVGKTHLLQGLCNAVAVERPQTNWLYLSAEDFANQFVLALKTRKLEAFRRRMRQTDLLAIDDIHFLASKPSTQEEFLHTFNKIDLAGKQVALVSDAHPKMIGQISEKLVNRFVSGMVVQINNPDFQTRYQICKQYAARGKKDIPENVLRYTAENLRTNVRELEGALLKLIAFASLQNQKIELQTAKQLLAEHLARTDPIVHLSDIESVVSAYFGITPTDIHSVRKNRLVSLARHFSMYLARKHTKMSSAEIGRFMGNKNHATVLLACRKVEDNIKQNTQLSWKGPTGNRVAKARPLLQRLEDSIAT